jgi:hypothetical protein
MDGVDRVKTFVHSVHQVHKVHSVHKVHFVHSRSCSNACGSLCFAFANDFFDRAISSVTII